MMAKFNEHKRQKAKGEPTKEPIIRSTSSFQIVVPQCKVCQSPNRQHIDRMLTLGMSAQSVADQYSQIDGVKYSRKSFANHKNKHLTLRDTAVRRILEKRAEEVGLDVDDVAESMLTARGVLEAMVHKGFEGIVNEQVKIRPEDLLAALKQLKEEDAEFYSSSVQYIEDQLREEIDALIRAMKKVVPPAMQDEILAEYKVQMAELQNQRDALESGK